MKRSTDLGWFTATATAARLGTFARGDDGDDGNDTSTYAEVDVDVGESERAAEVLALGRDVRWRGGYSVPAVHRTLRSLLVMGATFPGDDPTDLVGVGSRPFLAHMVAVECDSEEAHGRTGVFRVFVREVAPIDHGGGTP